MHLHSPGKSITDMVNLDAEYSKTLSTLKGDDILK